MEAAPVKKKPEKKKVVTYLEIIAAINGLHPGLPPWPHKFHVYEPEIGIKELLLEGDKRIVCYVDDNSLTSAIVSYCNTSGKPKFYITNKEAQEITRMWMNMVEPVKDVKLFSFSDDDNLSFHKAPFPFPETCENPPPLFSDILERSTNKEALTSFIGSIFFEKSDRQQYLYLHGDGKNGKSALIDVLELALGPGQHSEVTPEEKSSISTHWTSNFLGKRLVVFTECESPKFPTSGIFKSLTGGDKTLINPKYRKAYSVRLNCKFIFLANNELMISSSKADQRRAIYCFINQNEKFIENYSDLLLDEAPRIIGYCMKKYIDAYPKHGSIRSNESSSLLDLEQGKFFNQYFIENKKGFVSLQSVQRLFQLEKITSPAAQGKFYDYIRIHHNVTKCPKGPKEKRIWVLSGASLKSGMDRIASDLNLIAQKIISNEKNEDVVKKLCIG